MELDAIYGLIESTSNMLRGMTLDPAIPVHAKEVMQSKIQTLEEALEQIEEQL